MKEVVVPAGERRRVLRRVSSSIPQTISFEFEPVAGFGQISGALEVRGSRWLFPKPPLLLDLEPTMTVRKGFWDTLFSVYVTPDQDVRVTVHRARLS